MKAKIISLLAITALTVSLFTVSAAADTNATSATVSTTQKKVVAKAPKLVKASASVKVNGSFKLKKVVKKLNKTSKYYFASANKKVASVSSKGKVKGVKKGTTIVNAYQKSTNACVATFKVTVKNRYNKASLRLMSSIIHSEAGNQSYAGRKAVGIVIMNRVKSSQFPNTIKGVVYQSGQFSPVRNGSLSRSYKLYDSGKMSKSTKKAAASALNGDKTVKLNKKKVNMKSFCFFSGYVKGARLSIDSHQFK